MDGSLLDGDMIPLGWKKKGPESKKELAKAREEMKERELLRQGKPRIPDREKKLLAQIDQLKAQLKAKEAKKTRKVKRGRPKKSKKNIKKKSKKKKKKQGKKKKRKSRKKRK